LEKDNGEQGGGRREKVENRANSGIGKGRAGKEKGRESRNHTYQE
jgi:hypothetical protein